MRVTDKMLYDMVSRGLSYRTERIMKTQRSIASGKRVNEPADDPLAMTRILDHRASLASIDQYTENIDQGISWLRATESSLYDANQLLERAKELVLSQVTITATDETREAAADDMEQIFGHMIQLANTRLGDRYIFSGFKTDTSAFLSTLDYTYRGDTGAIQIEIAKGQKITVNLNGSEVFTGGPVNIPQMLDDIITHLRTSDIPGLQGDIDDLDSSMGHILGKLAEVGAKTKQLETTKDHLQDLQLNVTELLSNIEDTDLAKAVAELSLHETAYQACLASAARVMETSLLDFLR